MEKEKAAKEKLDNDDEDKKKSLANEKVAAEDMRKRALERVGQTAKRKARKSSRDRKQKSPSRERVERAQVKQWNI